MLSILDKGSKLIFKSSILFPATLKDSALRWFMGLGEYSIKTWEDMKTAFLRKYQEYCKPRDSQNDVFRIQQLEDEILKDYL